MKLSSKVDVIRVAFFFATSRVVLISDWKRNNLDMKVCIQYHSMIHSRHMRSSCYQQRILPKEILAEKKFSGMVTEVNIYIDDVSRTDKLYIQKYSVRDHRPRSKVVY